ncbi:MAG: SMC-Scp complex subunit ScpB, partial [Clostridia bacterium]|nr:SMC-Scp complex subunit ScpB [Clostridia bacterium]
MEVQRYERIIEAVLFASGEPVSVSRLAEVLDIDADTVIGLCNQLSDRIDESGSALEIVRTDDKFQLCTKSEYAPYIRSAL